MQRQGQWVGRLAGPQPTKIVLDLDLVGEFLQGVIYWFPENENFLGMCADISIPVGEVTWVQSPLCRPLAPVTRDVIDLDNATSPLVHWLDLKPDLIECTFDNDEFLLKWKDHNENTFTTLLKRADLDMPSAWHCNPDVKTWGEFVSWAFSLENKNFIFRGQGGKYKLSTTFHRNGRFDLSRYSMNDMVKVRDQLSFRLNKYFDLNDINQRGVFYSLIQHHGFPTPLLDWTYSPFVAAFFAFRKLASGDGDDIVRIYALDRTKWENSVKHLSRLSPQQPHFSIIEFPSTDNPRHHPQQSVMGISNVVDIESHIAEQEARTGNTFLHVVELPRGIRPEVMRHLKLMGLTAASLFPDIDGECEALKERFFGHF